MKRISPPSISARQSFKVCVDGISSNDTSEHYSAGIDAIDRIGLDYVIQAQNGTLFNYSALTTDRGCDPIVIGSLTKKELVNLYKNYMVKKNKPARMIYDKIMVAANGKCPLCGGIGYPRTLDHYLEKALYPQFSVHPGNLIPSCRDCNLDKANDLCVDSGGKQLLHPYFDNEYFFSQIWITAKVSRTDPIVLIYEVTPPADWSDTDKLRVERHFQEYDLAKRFSLEAAEDLSLLINQRSGERGCMKGWPKEVFKDHLQSFADDPSLFPNHWKRVMYRALANDTEFCCPTYFD